MKQTTYFFIVLLISISNTIHAQGIRGHILDSEQQPVDAVAVVMQTLDSTYIDAVMSDSTGLFVINKPLNEPHRLLFQHLLYEPLTLEISTEKVGTVQLTSRDYALDEIVVKGERPVVRVEGGTLSYDIPRLIENKTSTNAYEAVREIPGVMGDDESLQLIGARSLHIIINGQLTTLSMDQLVQLLKSIPASRVEKVEVMYNAPAKYNVKGSVINVLLSGETSDTPSFQGEAGAYYTQKHFASGKAHTNLLYSTSRLSLDFMADIGAGRSFSGEDIEARHTLDEQVTHIDQSGRSRGKGPDASSRLGLDYTFANKDKLSATYYISWKDRNVKRNATTTFQQMSGGNPVIGISHSDTEMNDLLQNVSLQYDGHKGLMAGADFTYYHSPSDLYFLDSNNAGEETDLFNKSKQDVSRFSLFANHTSTIGNWQLNYGAQGGYSKSDNLLEYAYNTGNGYIPAPDQLEDNTQKDYNANVFVETTAQLGPRLSASVALKADYFKSDYKSLKEETTLWEEWTFLPTVSLSYTFSPYHIMQLNVSSDKTYPSYWELSPQRYPLNSYSETVGNPQLKPYRSYDMQLMYILKQKYIFMAFASYEPDYFTQVPYQSEEEIKNVFRYENFDYSLKTGLVAIVPFKVGSFWDSRWTLQGFRMQEKSDHFHDMTFNRKDYVFVGVTQNTFNLSTKPNLKLTIDGLYASGGIQGIYDLGSMYRIDAGLKYTFAKDKASLTLTAYDIFESGYPRTIAINEGNQWSRMEKLNDIHYVRLAFVYKFGGYKAKEHKAVDTSRLGI